MTQAFNLGQLANKVNTSGQLDASTGLVNSAAVANGGTGRSTLDTGKVLLGAGTAQVTMLAGTTTNDALIWNGTAWASSPVSSAGGGGGYQLSSYTSPSSYTKPASLKAIKVTVVGSGGNGGNTGPMGGTVIVAASGGGSGGASIYYAPAPTLPASAIPITAGTGTNSFGAIASATAGSPGVNVASGVYVIGGSSGVGSGGTFNIKGNNGFEGYTGVAGGGGSGFGGASILGGGGGQIAGRTNGNPAGSFGGGGGGAAHTSPGPTATTTYSGGTGGSGVVIIEEFF